VSSAVATARASGATVIDTRDDQEFAAGHLLGSINIPADGRFAETAGMVLQPADQVIVIAAPGGEQEVATRLARIGYDQTIGYVPDVEAALVALQGEVGRSSRLTPAQLDDLMSRPDAPWVLDVRNVGEYDQGAIPGATHIPLAELGRRLDEVPAHRSVVAYCAGGWRSSVAASFLRHRGYTDVSDLAGGFAAWDAVHAPLALS
jgi:hydroxyacylglutathione hydrolase